MPMEAFKIIFLWFNWRFLINKKFLFLMTKEVFWGGKTDWRQIIFSQLKDHLHERLKQCDFQVGLSFKF